MSASLKLRQLESKISTLQTQHQNLLKDRQQEIAGLITSLELAHVEDNLLIGSLLFLKDKISIQDPILEAWRLAGDRFLSRKQKNLLEFSRKTPPLPKQLQHLTQNLNCLKARLNREKNKMQKQQSSQCKVLTRMMI
ncbi:MAG: hypothetical protein MRY83_24050 [Flavobacteriales bacterium]|nr:hypothetical protein [Flavobacteriales bacterium]